MKTKQIFTLASTVLMATSLAAPALAGTGTDMFKSTDKN
jgi:hypothetical protein